MSMGHGLVSHLAMHAVFMGVVAVGGLGAIGVALTPSNAFAAAVDMNLSMVGDSFSGVVDLFNLSGSAEGADYAWGMMDHGAGAGAGHDMVAHGGDVVSHEIGHGSSLSAEHADACSVTDMIAWEGGEPDLADIDVLIDDGLYGSRAEYYSEFCHDHS